MEDIVLSVLVPCLCSSGFTAIILECLRRHWAKKDRQTSKEDAIVNGLKVLMVDRVRYLGRCYIQDGQIEFEDKENLKEMHKAYQALGGNGHLDATMEEVKHLKVIVK